MKFTHSYNAPAVPTMPENPRDDELAVISQAERDLGDMLSGQLGELGRTVLTYIKDHAGVPFLIEWSDTEQTPVDTQTFKFTLSVDVKRYREPKQPESKGSGE